MLWVHQFIIFNSSSEMILVSLGMNKTILSHFAGGNFLYICQMAFFNFYFHWSGVTA